MPPSACSKRPTERAAGAGEGALLVAEQFAFDQVARDRGHVDGDERAAFALAVIVQRARDEFLAGARFAGDHHRQVGLHQPGERTEDVLHRRRAADERHRLGRLRCVVRLLAPRFGSASARPTMATSSFRSKGFGRYSYAPRSEALIAVMKVFCALITMIGRSGRMRLMRGSKLERVVVGHHDVGDDEVALAGRDPAPQPGDRAGRAHFVAGAGQRLIEHRPNRRVVVGDQNMP